MEDNSALVFNPMPIWKWEPAFCWHEGVLMQAQSEMISGKIEWRKVPDSNDQDFPFPSNPKNTPEINGGEDE